MRRIRACRLLLRPEFVSERLFVPKAKSFESSNLEDLPTVPRQRLESHKLTAKKIQSEREGLRKTDVIGKCDLRT